MIEEIGLLINSTKAVYTIAKGISFLKSEVEKNEAVSKILEALLSLQTEALSVNEKTQELQEENYRLTNKMREFENWSETEKQYELKEIDRGTFVYASKKNKTIAEPVHWLCTNCWKDRKRSILQKFGGIYKCPSCKTEIYPFTNQSSDYTDCPENDYNSDPFHRGLK